MPIFKPQRHNSSGFLRFGTRLPLLCLPTAYRLPPTVRRNAFRQVFDHLRRGAPAEVLFLLPLARRAHDVS
jgi:hypothetical protein